MNQTVLKWQDNSANMLPDKIAFTDSDRSITFGEFDRISKAIGTFLAGKTAPNAPVVVMSGRHVLTPAVFLGVVRAGCFYAPMDATMPVARLNQILSVIQAKFMLVDKDFLAVAEKLEYDGQIIVIDEILDTPVQEELLEKVLNEADCILVGMPVDKNECDKIFLKILPWIEKSILV